MLATVSATLRVLGYCRHRARKAERPQAPLPPPPRKIKN